MFKKVLYIVLFVVLFIILPIVVGALVQKYWGQQGYGILAGVGTWFFFSIVVMLIEGRRARNINRG